MCFITPKRLRCGKASTIWVVVRGPCRKRSRIARLVLSDNAFHTLSSSSSGTLTPLRADLHRAILGDFFQHVLPTGGHTLSMRGIDKPYGAMTKIHVGTCSALFELHFNVIQRRVGHEQGAAQFKQDGRLDNLHVPPKMADAVAAIAEPAAPRPLLHSHLQRFALRLREAFAKPVQKA